jgi:hypothetical protein
MLTTIMIYWVTQSYGFLRVRGGPIHYDLPEDAI